MSCIRTRGKKSSPHLDPADPPRRRANKQKGHGTYETDRPPIFSVKSRETGELRYFVQHKAAADNCYTVVSACVPSGATIYTDEWRGYNCIGPLADLKHATVKHGKDEDGYREWARDDNGDGIKEVHCNSCEGAGTALRNFLRIFRGVHKQYLDEYVATFQAMSNAKKINSYLIRRMSYGLDLLLIDYP